MEQTRKTLRLRSASPCTVKIFARQFEPWKFALRILHQSLAAVFEGVVGVHGRRDCEYGRRIVSLRGVYLQPIWTTVTQRSGLRHRQAQK